MIYNKRNFIGGLPVKHLFLALSLIFTFPTLVLADFDGCGIYNYKGTVKIKNNKMNLFIHEGTKSEMTFVLSVKQEGQLAPYLNRQVSGKVFIQKPMDGTKAAHFTIIDSERSGANPLVPKEHSFLKKTETKPCEK